MFSEKMVYQAGQNKKKYWYQIFLLKHIVQLWIWNNSISKLSTKMFIKNPKQ